MQIVKESNNFIIDGSIVIGDTPQQGKIFLSTKIGSEMNYKKIDYKYIDFPGEYEFEEKYIVCTNDDDKLNYKIRLKDKYLGFIQSPRFIKDSFVEDMDDVLVTNEDLVTKLSKTDFDGNIHDVSKI